MIQIRPIKPADYPALLPLMAALGYPASLEQLKARAEKFLAQKGAGFVVAVKAGGVELIGWVAWTQSNFLISDKTRFHVEGLVVDEAYRGLGVGKKLMDYVEEIAQAFSPAIIDLTSGTRRAAEGTHEFYHKLGYKNEGLMAKVYLRKEVS